MAELDNITLMMAIQAVNAEITKYEHLLTSETLRDREEIQMLVLSYQKAAESLRQAYESQWVEGGNLPSYRALVEAPQSPH